MRGYAVPNRVAAISAANGVVYDTFTDTNGTALSAHTPDTDTVGTGWESGRAGFTNLEIQSNEVVSSVAAFSEAVIDAGIADCTITADLTIDGTSSGYAGINFRFVDADNWWRAELSAQSNIIQVYESNAGTVTVRTAPSVTLTAGTYTLTVVLNGSDITATVEGVTASVTSALHATATKHGAYVRNTNGAVDNFKVSA